MERRDFIHACAVLFGSTVLPMGCGQGGPEQISITDDLSGPGLRRSKWVNIPDTSFSVAHETYGAIDMMMTAIDDEIFDPVTDQFSIVMTGPEQPLLEEGVYDVYNSSLGYIELYFQPADSPAGEQRYRALFSILHS